MAQDLGGDHPQQFGMLPDHDEAGLHLAENEVDVEVAACGLVVVAEVAFAEDDAQAAQGPLFVTRGVEGHFSLWKAETVDCEPSEELPAVHQPERAEVVPEAGAVDLRCVDVEIAAPVAELTQPDSALEQVVRNMLKYEHGVEIHRRQIDFHPVDFHMAQFRRVVEHFVRPALQPAVDEGVRCKHHMAVNLNGAAPAIEMEMLFALVLPAFTFAERPDYLAAAQVSVAFARIQVDVAAHAQLWMQVCACDTLALQQYALDALTSQSGLEFGEHGVEPPVRPAYGFYGHEETAGGLGRRHQFPGKGAGAVGEDAGERLHGGQPEKRLPVGSAVKRGACSLAAPESGAYQREELLYGVAMVHVVAGCRLPGSFLRTPGPVR